MKKVIQIDDKKFEVDSAELLRKAFTIKATFKSLNEEGRIASLKSLATITFLATHLEESELLYELTQVRQHCIEIVNHDYEMSFN